MVAQSHNVNACYDVLGYKCVLVGFSVFFFQFFSPPICYLPVLVHGVILVSRLLLDQ